MTQINELENQIKEELPCCTKEEHGKQSSAEKPKRDKFIGVCIVIAAVILGGSWIYNSDFKNKSPEIANAKIVAELERVVLPAQGVTLPAVWEILVSKCLTRVL